MDIKSMLFVPSDICMSEIPSRIGAILYICCVITILILLIIKIPYILGRLLTILSVLGFIISVLFKIKYYMTYCGNIVEVLITMPFILMSTFGTPILILYFEMGDTFIPYLIELHNLVIKMRKKVIK